ncbi:GNAT family N-acetyltransferase [Kribbella sp. NBC_01505]|uniref:GNAT family N-acetyltransferase n=1 Tax=Kribbella sp. NBC_01505 TaxID=2903580 RepID=UPI003863A399
MITERIDPHDPVAFDEWHGVLEAGVTAGREFAVHWPREEMRAVMIRSTPYFAKEIWAARDESGRMVGVLFVDLPLQDNLNLVSMDIAVLPEFRRQGYGTALAALGQERAAEHGRSIVQAMVHSPIDGSAPGQSFARAQGMTVGIVDRHRILRLPLDEAFLTELAAEVADHHRDYRLVSWQGRCPDDLVDGYAALESTFNDEIPLGDLATEAEVYDAARVRSREQQAVAQGRQSWVTAAIAPDGAFAGHTEIFYPTHDPINVFQSGTLVAPAHRGHRLGLALKVANHLVVQRAHSEPRVLHTWNAEQNTAMNAVNERLGYRPVELTEEWQRKL